MKFCVYAMQSHKFMCRDYTSNMSYDEFKANLKVAGLSVKKLAELLEMAPNSITNYRAKGVVPRYLAVVARLLLELRALGVDINRVIEEARRR